MSDETWAAIAFWAVFVLLCAAWLLALPHGM